MEIDFHTERRTGIGGSDAPAVLGLSERKTALDVYAEKKGQAAPFEDNAATRWGRLLEPAVRQEYAERTGRTVTQPREMLRHPKHPFIIGHPDGLVPDVRRGYEGKTARTDRGWGEPGTDQIPTEYIIQVQHYMLLVAYEVFDVAVLIGGQDFRMYEVPADPELQELIVEAENDLWQRVQRGEPPEPDWNHAHVQSAIRTIYKGTTGEVLTATEAQEKWRFVFEDAAEHAAMMDKVAESAKARLLWDMKDAAILKFADGKCLRRKEVSRKGYTVADTKYMDARIANYKE